MSAFYVGKCVRCDAAVRESAAEPWLGFCQPCLLLLAGIVRNAFRLRRRCVVCLAWTERSVPLHDYPLPPITDYHVCRDCINSIATSSNETSGIPSISSE